ELLKSPPWVHFFPAACCASQAAQNSATGREGAPPSLICFRPEVRRSHAGLLCDDPLALRRMLAYAALMHAETFKEILRAQPFQPFTVHTVSGETYLVDHPISHGLPVAGARFTST